MIMELLLIIICEVIVLLGILIVYWADYTNSYLHCHCSTEPYHADEEYRSHYENLSSQYWQNCYESLYESIKDKADDTICDGLGTVVGVLFDD